MWWFPAAESVLCDECGGDGEVVVSGCRSELHAEGEAPSVESDGRDGRREAQGVQDPGVREIEGAQERSVVSGCDARMGWQEEDGVVAEAIQQVVIRGFEAAK